MLSFWAGGISSFPPCAREYRLLRMLGISLRILPCNSSTQACIKSVGNHAKKSYKIPVFSALAFTSACAKFYELYSILHILTQLIQIFNIVSSDLLLCASRL